MRRYDFIWIAAAVNVLLCIPAKSAERPNVVFVMADDHRRDLMSCMGHPFIKTHNMDRIADEGLLFERAFCVTATCSPSRASVWTGKYPHQASHPSISEQGNSFLLTQTPFPKRLHDAGYATGHIGKWHLTKDLEPKPGYDYWAGTHMMPVDDPTITINGKDQKFEGFIDDVLSGLAVDFIEKHSKDDKPFFLSVGLKCPHLPYPYPERLANMFEDVDIPKPDSYNENYKESGRAPMLEKSIIRIRHSRLWKGRYKTWDNYIKRHYRSVQSLDESLGMIDEAIRKAGIADNTILIYTSDHGYSLGEHGLTEKHYAYHHPASVPLIMRWPKGIKAGARPKELALLIDLAPTVLESCGVPVPADMRGRSLKPLFNASGKPVDEWRRDFLFTYDSRHGGIPGQYALCSDKYKIVRYQKPGYVELYDLVKDPKENRNVARNPEYAGILRDMQARLEQAMERENFSIRQQRSALKHCRVRGGLAKQGVQALSRKLYNDSQALDGFKKIEASGEHFQIAEHANANGVLVAVPMERTTEWDPYVAMWVDKMRTARLWFNGEVIWEWPNPKGKAGHFYLMNPPMVHKTETALLELIGKDQKPLRIFCETPENSVRFF